MSKFINGALCNIDVMIVLIQAYQNYLQKFIRQKFYFDLFILFDLSLLTRTKPIDCNYLKVKQMSQSKLVIWLSRDEHFQSLV